MGLGIRSSVPLESVPTLLICTLANTMLITGEYLTALALPLGIGYMFWALSPFVTALLVRVFIGEAISTATIVAMVLGLGAFVCYAISETGT